MRNILAASVFLVVAGLAATSSATKDPLAGKIPGLKLENLMTEVLGRVKNTEVIVSRLTIPPNTTFPKHWHPGEEFVYIIEGSATVVLEGEPEVQLKAGQVFKIPLKKVHTAKTGAEGAKAIAFRVHEKGKPMRVKAD